MPRKGDTVLAAALKRYGKKIKKYIQDCIVEPLTVKVLIEDARDSAQKASGAISIEIEIKTPEGWGGDNIVEIHGSVGLEKSGKSGKKEDEAYLDGVTVGDWDEGSKAIGLNGCSIGEFLVHMFTLFAIKAGNESVLLDNAAGPRGEHIYKQVGFIKSKGDRAQYGDDNEMMFPLTGKKKNKDAGQLWRERYNKFRKKLKTKIKNSANCKTFWKCVPPALEAPGPVHAIARGSKRMTRNKRGGDAERPPITLNKQQFINMVENNPDKVYKIIRNLRTEGMDDPDDPDYGFNVWYPGKIEYEGFDEDWGDDVFGFTMYDEGGDEIRWGDTYTSLKTGPDTEALDYEWTNIKDAGQPIKFVGGKRRKKKTRKKRGGQKIKVGQIWKRTVGETVFFYKILGKAVVHSGTPDDPLPNMWKVCFGKSTKAVAACEEIQGIINGEHLKEHFKLITGIEPDPSSDEEDELVSMPESSSESEEEVDEEEDKAGPGAGGGKRKKKTRKKRGGVKCPPRKLQIIDNKDEKLIPGERYLFIPSAMNNIAGGVGLGWIPTHQVPEHDEYFLNTCVSGTYIRKGTEQEPDMYVFLGKTLFDTPCFWGVTADAIWFPSDMSLGAQGMKAKPGAGGGRRRKKKTRKKRGGNECKDKSKEDCEKKPLSLICKWGKKKTGKKQVGRFIVDTYGPEHCYQFRDKKSWMTPALQARVPEYKDFIRGTTPEKKPSEFDKKGGKRRKKKTRKKRGGLTVIADKHNLVPGRIYFYKRHNSNWIFKGTYEGTNGTNVHFNNWSGAENQGENMGRIGGDDQQHAENINRIETIWTIDDALPEVLSQKISSFVGGKRRKKKTRKKKR